MRTWFRCLLMPRSLLGLALFVLPWLWVLRTPATRNLFIKQVTGNTGLPPAVPWAGSLNYPYGTRNWFPADLTGVPPYLGAQYPNDPQIQAKLAENAAGGPLANYKLGQPRFAQMRAYRDLLKRFPHESWLYTHYLRDAIVSFRDERLAGAFSSHTSLSPYANAPESTGKKPNFSPQQLNEAIAIARQGQEVEPDNAVLGLYEGILLWMGHRDAEAWRALHHASLLPRYDEHNYEEAHAVSRVISKWRGPMLWEEELTLSESSPYLYYSPLRERARQWSWAAWKLERAGQHQEAIAKRTDIVRLFNKTMHGNNTFIIGMVGEAIIQRMLAGDPQRSKTSPAFAMYARAHGEPTLAQEIMQLGQDEGIFRGMVSSTINSGSRQILPSSLAYQTRALWWLACGILFSGVLLLVVWLLTSALLIRTTSEHATPRFVISVVMLCCLTTTLLYGKCNGASIESLFTYGTTTLSIPLTISIMVMQVAAFFLPLLIPALLCGVPTWWRLSKERRAARQQREMSRLPRDMRPLIWTFAAWCALLTAVFGWIVAAGVWVSQPQDVRLDLMGFMTTLNGETLPAGVTIIASLASVLLLCGWLFKWRFFLPTAERLFASSALRRFHTVLGALLIVGSWSYVSTLSATLAPRDEADRLMDRALQQGEVGRLTAQLAPQTRLAPSARLIPASRKSAP